MAQGPYAAICIVADSVPSGFEPLALTQTEYILFEARYWHGSPSGEGVPLFSRSSDMRYVLPPGRY